MRMKNVRGSSIVELALLVPLLALLIVGLFQLGDLLIGQLQLERLSFGLVRYLGTLGPQVSQEAAHEWLISHGHSDIQAEVQIKALSSLPRTFPRSSRPVQVVMLTLSREKSALAKIVLKAHAREVLW